MILPVISRVILLAGPIFVSVTQFCIGSMPLNRIIERGHQMLEVNTLLSRVKELSERTELLRRYL